MNQEQNEQENSPIKQKVNFQLSKVIELELEVQPEFRIRNIYLSPYNSLFLVEQERVDNYLQMLFKYENGSLKTLKRIPQNYDEDITSESSRNCLFMKNSNEFIIISEFHITLYKIEQDSKWRMIQTVETYDIQGGFLSQDEKTLYRYGNGIQVYERSSQQKRHRCYLWILSFRVELKYTLNSFILGESFKCIVASNNAFIGILKPLKKKKFINYLLRLNYRNAQVKAFINDEFVIINLRSSSKILQWNKQTRKIIRQYEQKIQNEVLFCKKFDRISKLFICRLGKKTTVCRFKNGSFRVMQIVSEQDSDQSQIGNNGLLSVDLDKKTVKFYEQKQ